MKRFLSFAMVSTVLMSQALLAKEFVLKVKPNSFAKMASGLTHLKMVQVTDLHETGSLILVDLPDNPNALAPILKQLYANKNVEYLVENIKFHMVGATNDPKFSEQWALEKVRAQDAWSNFSTGSKKVVVAVIDTGVAWNHEDLASQMWTNPNEIPGNGIDDDNNGYIDDVRGWDFFASDNDPMDETSDKNPGHGTHCAGIIGAAGNNGIGVSGMAQDITIMPIRFLGADGSGDLMAAAKAIDYAIINHADVISASWGAAVARAQIQPILEAIGRANEKGVVFVAAAANDGKSNDTREVYPANAALDNVISVAASNPSDGKPQWSNYGRASVDLSSPGEDILSTLPNNSYGKLSGTSMATPLVAGLVSLEKSHALQGSKVFTPASFKAILQASGSKSEIETACSCRVDAHEALRFIDENSLVVVPNALTIEESKEKQFSGIGGQAPYRFQSSNPAVASITEDGLLKSVTKGETQITITDNNGVVAQSHGIFVGKADDTSSGGQCPFQSPIFCQIFCQIEPTLPWCN